MSTGNAFRLTSYVVISMILLTSACAQERIRPKAKVEPFSFRDWAGCFRLTNGSTEVVIVPSAGARVVVFALEGKNVLLVDEKTNGRVVQSKKDDRGAWMPWDGSAPDTLAPENGSQLAHIWLGQYEVTDAGPLHLKCISQDNIPAGIRMEKEFRLDPKRPVLTIKRTITNLKDKSAKWGFWERTLTPGSVVGVAPVNPKSVFGPAGWAKTSKGKHEPGKLDSANPKVVDGVLLLRPAGKGMDMGLDAVEGWTGGVVNDVFFGITFPIWPDKPYSRGKKISNVFYFADNRVEIEPMSPYFDIAPGKTADWTIKWHLVPLGKVPGDDKVLAARVRELASKLETK